MSSFNQLSGKYSTGNRFRFHVRAIAHNSLYLPVAMANIPEIQHLINGVSPLVVFSSESIHQARKAFCELRMQYDFPFWAALHFFVRDISDRNSIVPLRLNRFQHYLVDQLSKNIEDRLPSAFIISKTLPKCGLTTCVQAYLLWSQLYGYMDHSILYADSSQSLSEFKGNMARYLKKKDGYSRYLLDSEAHSSFFQPYYSPEDLDGVQAGFVHLADMDKWIDSSDESSRLIYKSTLSGWSKRKGTLYIMEGNRPSNHNFKPSDYRNYLMPENIRLMQLHAFSSNPFFLNRLIVASDPKVHSSFRHIDLDLSFPEIVLSRDQSYQLDCTK